MKVLVVAAHPDDEVLGCGGTMAMHAARGDKVSVLILAEGLTSRGTGKGCKKRLGELAKAARRANAKLGVSQVELLGLPDNRLDSLDRLDVVQAVETVVARVRPDTVYTHHAGDLNLDHQITHEAVATACRPLPGQCVRQILCFEVPSSTEWRLQGAGAGFQPNWYVDIGKGLDAKVAALEAYAMEMRPWPHARSCEALVHLARWRGASVGVEAAEAFVLGRRLEVL